MNVLGLTLLLIAAEPDLGLAKKMLPLYVKEAETYSLAIESAPKKGLELKKEPVFEWVNPDRSNQQGAVFLWLREGRPAALACIFSHPHEKLPGRQIMHELHALDPEKLLVKRSEYNQWKPEAGLARKELPDAGVPAETAGARLLQMRRLAQEFTGFSVDRDAKRWELRLLPTPLYRYPAAKTGVVDGALYLQSIPDLVGPLEDGLLLEFQHLLRGGLDRQRILLDFPGVDREHLFRQAVVRVGRSQKQHEAETVHHLSSTGMTLPHGSFGVD